MSTRDPFIRYRHMLDHAREAVAQIVSQDLPPLIVAFETIVPPTPTDT